MTVRYLKKKWLLFVMVFAVVTLTAQDPGLRNGHNMVYFAPAKAIILFGGANEKEVCNDTWKFAAGKWKRIADNGPSPRTFPGMVAAGSYILLFGGNSVLFGNDKNPVHYLDDTWKYENDRWQKVECATHPGPRSEMAMAYDPVRKKVVLFGGRQSGSEWIRSDTWEFDGKTWIQKQVKGPTARSGAVMCYFPLLNRIILFGGNPVISKEPGYNGAMWSWDGLAWQPIYTSVPLIFNTAMSFDTAGNFLLRFGGWTGEKRINETWIYKYREWKKLDLTISPAARNHTVMVYDQGRKSFILYGGHDGDRVFGDMWEFKSNKWSLLHDKQPLKHLDNGH